MRSDLVRYFRDKVDQQIAAAVVEEALVGSVGLPYGAVLHLVFQKHPELRAARDELRHLESQAGEWKKPDYQRQQDLVDSEIDRLARQAMRDTRGLDYFEAVRQVLAANDGLCRQKRRLVRLNG